MLAGIFNWVWARQSARASMNFALESAAFTVRHGKRYRAAVVLGWVEQQFATNSAIEGKLTEAGFKDVRVSGAGEQRSVVALWPGPDTTGPLDSHLRDVKEIPNIAPNPDGSPPVIIATN